MKRFFYFCGLLLLVVNFVWLMNYDPETAPFWFAGNQLDWEVRHYVNPEGADEVSQHFINEAGIQSLPHHWKKKRIVAYNFHYLERYEWEGDKLLIRMVDGGTIHLPLTVDPWKTKTSLRLSLHPDDVGRILKANAH